LSLDDTSLLSVVSSESRSAAWGGRRRTLRIS
jgi:hypothetical protein